MKCNETFRTNFGINAEVSGKSSISELIPSSEQRLKHSELMAKTWKLNFERQKEHKDYECLLSVDRTLFDIKLKVLEKYRI